MLPHNLSREEARTRLRAHAHEIANFVPGGMAQVETAWVDEDRMDLTIHAMGQTVRGDIRVEDAQLAISIAIPAMLGFIEPMVSAAIREHGPKLLV